MQTEPISKITNEKKDKALIWTVKFVKQLFRIQSQKGGKVSHALEPGKI